MTPRMTRPTPTRLPRGVAPAVQRQRAPWRLALLVVALAAGALYAGRSYLIGRSLAWQATRGLAALAEADSPTRVRAALDRWEHETRAFWEPRRPEFIAHLFTRYPLEDRRVRLLLTRVSGADYGPRRADWQRWYDAYRRGLAGDPPQVPRREAVTLQLAWRAPVGLTAWFTTILPLDGQIYVASLGAAFDDVEDSADGIVRVDGATGEAGWLFNPPPVYRGPRDVIGLAAGEECLFVACYNGAVFCVDAAGQSCWHVHVSDPIVAPPLSIDINRDGTADVVVATRAGRVIALSGKQGKTIWVAGVARPTAGQNMLGATLAVGNVLGQADAELVVTMPPGDVEVLALQNGRSLWRHTLGAGSVAGALCRAELPTPGPPVYLADRAASVWSLAGAGRTLEAIRAHALAVHRDETLVAGLRTLSVAASADGAAGNPAGLLLACVTGEYGSGQGAVSALLPEAEYWRLPLSGAIWGTPAVADLNRDGQPDIVVATIEDTAGGVLGGALVVVSSGGHLVQRVAFDAPIECSPVVADVDGDSRLEVLVADQSGYLYCFKTEGYGPVEWGLFGGDSHNTRNAASAYAYGQRLYGYQWKWHPERAR